MTYKVVITPRAKQRLDRYILYTRNVLRNVQAAKAIALDAKDTKEALSSVAGSLQLCIDPSLANLGYRIIRFRKHDFLMLYRIEGNIVYVEGMYHELQDYEATFVAEIGL